MKEIEESSAPVMLFDGVCGLCNHTVQQVLRYDRHGRIRFAALQSNFAAAVIERHPELAGTDSVVLVENLARANERVLVRSAAILRLAALLGGIWRILLIGYLIPAPLRDFCYDLIAKYRYRFFGKHESCMIPSPEVRARFIES